MDKESKIQKKFLEDQLEWCMNQDAILKEIEVKLYEMKEIAEHALEQSLEFDKVTKLNNQLNELKREVMSLEKQLHGLVH